MAVEEKRQRPKSVVSEQTDNDLTSGEISEDIRLDKFNSCDFDRGRSAFIEAFWIVTQSVFVRSFIPGSAHRRLLLRLFGATVGKGVVIKPGVRVKFPWRLVIGDHTWIGEDVWIDNLGSVRIGKNVCVSQGAYLCTGSHNWASERFDLKVADVTIGDGAWIAAKSVVGPGVTIGDSAILTLGSVATKNLPPWSINSGNPARETRKRRIRPL